MGLSVAYCDNDDPNENPLKRDHFFGSVDVPQANQNDHWINANWFGVAKLTKGTGTGVIANKNNERELFTMSIDDEILNLGIHSPHPGKIKIRLLNAAGAEMFTTQFDSYSETQSTRIELKNLSRGFYMIDVMQGNLRKTAKFIY